MGYKAVWNVLEEMLIEFRKKELMIPPSIMEDLKSAKTVMLMMTEGTRAESLQKIEQYLLNVESYLVSEGQKKLGFDYVEGWLRRIDKAGREIDDEKHGEMRFIPGLSRQKKWIRVTSSNELPVEKLKSIAEKMSIFVKVQKDGSLLALGEEQSIKDFVKKLALNQKAKAPK
jgi:hypothetical protein